MNMERLAALIVRLFGCNFLFSAVNYCTYLPYDWSSVELARARGMQANYELNVHGVYVRILLHALAGAVCLIGWRQMVAVLTGGLSKNRPVA